MSCFTITQVSVLIGGSAHINLEVNIFNSTVAYRFNYYIEEVSWAEIQQTPGYTLEDIFLICF